MRIGAKLAQCREKLNGGKTQADVAAELNITREYLAALETDRGQPSYDLLVRLANYYDTSIDYFFGRRERVLPKGGAELLEILSTMSPRTRTQLIAIARALQEEEQEWQSFGFGYDAVESLFGEEFIEEIKRGLALLTASLGSTEAAIAELRSIMLSNISSDKISE